MSEAPTPGKLATDTAEKILVAIYGEDLTGCQISPDSVAGVIQQAMNVETRDYRQLAEALIGAIRQIQVVATPPDKSEVESVQDLAETLGKRADAIQEISTKIIQAWDEFKGPGGLKK